MKTDLNFVHGGDVFFVRFPYEENINKPAEKVHPCIVLDIDDAGRVLFAYGTSHNATALLSHEFAITEKGDGIEAMEEAGLEKDTRFDLSRRRWIPMTNQWVAMKTGKVPRRLLHRLMRAATAAGIKP